MARKNRGVQPNRLPFKLPALAVEGGNLNKFSDSETIENSLNLH